MIRFFNSSYIFFVNFKCNVFILHVISINFSVPSLSRVTKVTSNYRLHMDELKWGSYDFATTIHTRPIWGIPVDHMTHMGLLVYPYGTIAHDNPRSTPCESYELTRADPYGPLLNLGWKVNRPHMLWIWGQ